MKLVGQVLNIIYLLSDTTNTNYFTTFLQTADMTLVIFK